jgi:catechol 2,3-dioxygenase-like lactoylglutathione lyase family enzyme
MLRDAKVATRLPAQDLERARAFYSEKLGLVPVEERRGGLLYRCGSGDFAVFETSGAPSGDHAQMAFDVENASPFRSAPAAASVTSALPPFGFTVQAPTPSSSRR